MLRTHCTSQLHPSRSHASAASRPATTMPSGHGCRHSHSHSLGPASRTPAWRPPHSRRSNPALPQLQGRSHPPEACRPDAPAAHTQAPQCTQAPNCTHRPSLQKAPLSRPPGLCAAGLRWQWGGAVYQAAGRSRAIPGPGRAPQGPCGCLHPFHPHSASQH